MNGFPSTDERLDAIADDLRDIAKRLDALCASSHSLAEQINAVPDQSQIEAMARGFAAIADYMRAPRGEVLEAAQ